MQIAIIVPTLDEAQNVAPLVSQIEATGVGFSEIIFVDDGSTDGTVENIWKLAPLHRLRLIQRDAAERGLAGAILAGAKSASAEALVVMDADLSHPPEKISALLTPLLAGEADLVVGSRYVKGGTTPGWPLWRRLLSRTASLAALPLTGIHDSMGGFFAVRRDLMLEFADKATGFKIVFEMIVRGRRRLRVQELPIVFRDRTRGKSKMSVNEAARFGRVWVGAILRRLVERKASVSSLEARQLSRNGAFHPK